MRLQTSKAPIFEGITRRHSAQKKKKKSRTGISGESSARHAVSTVYITQYIVKSHLNLQLTTQALLTLVQTDLSVTAYLQARDRNTDRDTLCN